MAISDGDYKLLWGRAAGICSNPSCRTDLTIMLEDDAYNVGEMAHIIAHSERGPRGEQGGGSDSYANLVLLCPTCHRKIDKAPEGEFPVQLLLDWKAEHETQIRSVGQQLKFDDFADLRNAVAPKLAENGYIWKKWGPQSAVADSDPSSNAFRLWELRKLSTILPNNRYIANAVGSNERLLSNEQLELFFEFKDHVEGFEKNQYGRLDSYTLFPGGLLREFGNG